jgi:aryl-alcohol dehydrogenase-like predicted oxidoreductase
MIFGEQSGRATPDGEAKEILSAFIEAGGNFIDTANGYAAGRSEEIIGEWMQGLPRDSMVIATKVRFPRGGGPNEEGLSRKHIMAEVENSLRRLRTDYIDLYYLHMWDTETPLEETLRALDDLVTAGKVRYTGVSNFKAWQVMKALAISDTNGYARFAAGQYQYSLVVRDIEHEFLDLMESEGLGHCPWGPLGGGFLTGKYMQGQRPEAGRISKTPAEWEESWEKRNTAHNWGILEAVDAVAQKYETTLSQVAINWLLTRRATSSVIVGVRTLAQLADNLGAAGWDLDKKDLATLEKASVPKAPYPYRLIEKSGVRRNS